MEGETVFASGTLLEKNHECWMVAPRANTGGAQIKVAYKDGRPVPATLYESLGEEVGLYRLTSDEPFFCASLWPDEQRIALLLESGRQAYLDSSEYQPVSLRTDESGAIRLEWPNPLEAPEIQPGTLVRIRSTPVAMVVGFDLEALAYRAVRLDEVGHALDLILSERAAQTSAEAPAVEIQPFEHSKDMRVSTRTKLKRQPASRSPSIKTLREGTMLEVLGKVKDQPWVAVRYYGLDGFLPESDLRQ